MVFMEESELSSKRWASAPRRSDSPCVLGAPTSREAAGPPVQLEPVDLSVKTPVVLQVPRYSPAAALITAARRIPSPSTTPTPPPLCASTVLADSNWRVQKCCCCCCEVKTATTVIGIITIISAIAEMSLPNLETPEEAATDEDSVVKAIRGRTVAAYVIECMVNTAAIALSGALIYGNCKGNTKWMVPYVYVLLIVIVIRILFDATAILSYLILGNFREGLPLLFFGVLSYSLSLYLWHVVRCRTLEIDEIEQPNGVVFTQRDPELPAYGDVQGTGGNVPGNYGGVQATYGNVQGTQGNVQGTYGNVQGPYGTAQGPVGNVQGPYGTAQGPVGNVQGPYGTAQGPVGNVQGSYGTPQGALGNAQGSYGFAQGALGNVQGSYGTAQGAYVNLQSINEKPQGEPPAYVNDRVN